MFNNLGYNFQGGQKLLRKIRTFEIQDRTFIKKIRNIRTFKKKTVHCTISTKSNFIFEKASTN